MKKFIALYYSSAEAMAQMANTTPEDRAKNMAPWMAWKEKCGGHIVDMGAPLMPGKSLDVKGKWSGGSTAISGYSIVQGNNLEEVKALFEGHPHVSWAPGCSIEIHEYLAM